MARREHHGPRGSAGAAWLLSQVGAHAAERFRERLAALELVPPHAGILRLISAEEGLSQRALSALIGLVPSRLVGLLDELEQRGLVERRRDPQDRRSHSLFLTDRGRNTLDAIGRVAREHQQGLLRALTEEERALLAALLIRVADDQGLKRGVHPGFARLRPGRPRPRSAP